MFGPCPDFGHSSEKVLFQSGGAPPYVFRFLRQLYLELDDQLLRALQQTRPGEF
jgi:hypothetical protein